MGGTRRKRKWLEKCGNGWKNVGKGLEKKGRRMGGAIK